MNRYVCYTPEPVLGGHFFVKILTTQLQSKHHVHAMHVLSWKQYEKNFDMNDSAQPGTKFHINFNDQLCCSTHDKHNSNL